MKTRYVIAPIVILALLAAFSTPASATCPCVTIDNDTINGGIYYKDAAIWPGSGSSGNYIATHTFTNVPAGVKIARVHTGVWMLGTGNIEITVNGQSSGVSPASCGGCNAIVTPKMHDYETGCDAHFTTYAATEDIPIGGGDVTVTVESTNAADGRIYTIALLVVYEDPGMPNMTYWINEGAWFIGDGPGYVYFNGAYPLGVDGVTYWTLGVPNGIENDPELNGNYIGDPDHYDDDLWRWDNISTDWLVPLSNLMYYAGPGDWERVDVAVFMLEHGESSPDTTPPYTEGHDPAKGATDVPPDTNIVVHVKDDGTGVNQSTIVMNVNGSVVTPDRAGDKYDYTLTYDPTNNFDYGQLVDVTVDAADLNTTPNVMTTDSYSFTIKELKPATPFFIYGRVNYDDGDPVNDPLVTVTNMNTSETYEVETMATSNYYQVLTCSENVSTGDVLHFTAIAETTTEFDHEVTAADMNRGGFEQNITIAKTPRPDLVITELNGYHSDTSCMPWFNLTNEIDVKVENIGDVNAGAFNVSLTIDDGYYARQNVPVLNVDENVTLTFAGWVPIGDDCFINCVYADTCHNYTITGVADCDNNVDEKAEENNATTVEERACYDGYMADEPLENVAHGILNGRLNFTTGSGTYGGLDSVGTTKASEYEITIPDGATMELAKLNVYYTWHEDTSCPQMVIRITNETDTYVVPQDTRYNDIKCTCPEALWIYPWGNYVYNVTDYISGSGTYIVTVERTGGSRFCIAAPGIVYVYEDANEPTIEYWINEGADILMGGRRYDGGYLAWWECINNATFPASTGTGVVANATLGVVTPWGDDAPDDILSFNDIELGRGVYHGYFLPYEETIDGMSMYIGSTNAQVGVNMTDVKAQYVHDSENMVSQADDGDNMMPGNAFLVVEYTEEEKEKDDAANADMPVLGTVAGSYVDTNVSDNVYEAITEIESKGNPANRYSYLEHKWTIDVTGGSSVTFYVEAYRTDSGEGDNFNFSYSTDGSIYTDMVTVTKTTDDGTCQTYGLPSDLSGTVYIRVKDTDQTAGNKVLDTIYIDHMFIRSVFGAPDTTAPAAVTDLAAGNPTSSSITLTWTAPGDDGNTGTATSYDVRYSTATITDTNWGSAAQCTEEPSPQPAGSSETFTVAGLDANTTYYFGLKTSDEVPNESPLSNVASNTTKEASANTMHIVSIDMSLKTAGPNTNAIALVTIVDAADAPVGSATVEGHWSNATSDSDSGTTDGSGQVSLNSDKVKNAPSGTNFTFTVDYVVKDGWTWDGVTKSNSTIVP